MNGRRGRKGGRKGCVLKEERASDRTNERKERRKEVVFRGETEELKAEERNKSNLNQHIIYTYIYIGERW